MIRPLAEVEKQAILAAVVEADYNLGYAAHQLGISRSSIHRRLRDWGLTSPYHLNLPDNKPVTIQEYRRRCDAILAALTAVKENLDVGV